MQVKYKVKLKFKLTIYITNTVTSWIIKIPSLVRVVSWEDVWNFEQSSLIDEKTDALTDEIRDVNKYMRFAAIAYMNK